MVWVGALSLVLGLATTVGVAKWAEEVSSPDQMAEVRLSGLWGEREGYGRIMRAWPTAASDLTLAWLDGPTALRHGSLTAHQWRELIDLSVKEGTPPPAEYRLQWDASVQVYLHRCGWPMRSFFTVNSYTMTEQGMSPTLAITTDSVLPYAPGQVIWWPLLINTAFLALPWAVLISLLPLAAEARRSHRRRRGHCPACNYNRKGLTAEAVCPECGKFS